MIAWADTGYIPEGIRPRWPKISPFLLNLTIWFLPFPPIINTFTLPDKIKIISYNELEKLVSY